MLEKLGNSKEREAARYFTMVYGSAGNFMTPKVYARGVVGDIAWEISTGTFIHDDITGVTIVDVSNPANPVRSDKSKMVGSISEAMEYIAVVAGW